MLQVKPAMQPPDVAVDGNERPIQQTGSAGQSGVHLDRAEFEPALDPRRSQRFRLEFPGLILPFKYALPDREVGDNRLRIAANDLEEPVRPRNENILGPVPPALCVQLRRSSQGQGRQGL